MTSINFLVLTNIESENRYTVKVPRGETLYYATENSTSFQRTCFGSSRAFNMRLYDQTQQEALHFKRRLACGSFGFCCYLQVRQRKLVFKRRNKKKMVVSRVITYLYSI